MSGEKLHIWPSRSQVEGGGAAEGGGLLVTLVGYEKFRRTCGVLFCGAGGICGCIAPSLCGDPRTIGNFGFRNRSTNPTIVRTEIQHRLTRGPVESSKRCSLPPTFPRLILGDEGTKVNGLNGLATPPVGRLPHWQNSMEDDHFEVRIWYGLFESGPTDTWFNDFCLRLSALRGYGVNITSRSGVA